MSRGGAWITDTLQIRPTPGTSNETEQLRREVATAKRIMMRAKPYIENSVAAVPSEKGNSLVRSMRDFIHGTRSAGACTGCNSKPCVCLELAAAQVGTGARQPGPYERTTDIALAAFQERWERMPASAADQQWVNGYARALQNMRTNSVPQLPEKTKENPITKESIYRSALERILNGPWPEGIDTPQAQCLWDAATARNALTAGDAPDVKAERNPLKRCPGCGGMPGACDCP
jgi:hypothetical protein